MWMQVLILCGVGGAITFSSANGGKKIVCYYGSWAVYRPGLGKCDIEDIDPNLCTHLIYTFVGINPNGTIKLLDSWNDLGKNGFCRFNALKQRNPNLKTLIAIGGWNEGSKTYSTVAANRVYRNNLITDAIQLMETYGFDGFDIDWEYPGDRGGSAADKVNFALWVKEFRVAIGNTYLLSMASGATPAMITTSYDVPTLSKNLDFINVMTYDLHGSWALTTGNHAPLYIPPSPPTISVSDCINAWISSGADASKLVMGIPTYGRTFTLNNINANGHGATANQPGTAGPYTQQPGMLGYNEICVSLQTGTWTTIWDNNQKAPYAYKGNQWVGYDSPQSVTEKVAFINNKSLGGAMIWSIETDDFIGSCGNKYPILRAINNNVNIG